MPRGLGDDGLTRSRYVTAIIVAITCIIVTGILVMATIGQSSTTPPAPTALVKTLSARGGLVKGGPVVARGCIVTVMANSQVSGYDIYVKFAGGNESVAAVASNGVSAASFTDSQGQAEVFLPGVAEGAVTVTVGNGRPCSAWLSGALSGNPSGGPLAPPIVSQAH